MTQKPKTSGLAITAFVLSLLCFPIGLILGIIALVQLGKTDDKSGKGLALAAVIISGAMLPVIGMLAAIAIPNFIRYQLRSKAMEAKVNLANLRAMQEARHADWERYLRADPAGGAPDPHKASFAAAECSADCSAENPDACASFDCLGFTPPGQVFFRYACEVTEDGQAYTCAALSDLDGNGELKLFVVGSGEGRLEAPIPDFDGRAPTCPHARGGEVVDCTPDVY
ncbi:MAG: hypothetical protein KC933_27335 [Myxococcales bacterium]|nr:hypothetical protein [Myxococcales bacterium]